jgi:hypothetical protein
VLEGRFTPEQGAVIRQALEKAMDMLFDERRRAPRRFRGNARRHRRVAAAAAGGTRRADALERLAESFLAGSLQALQAVTATSSTFTQEADVLAADGEAAHAECDDGGCVSAETSRRLACDAAVVHWHEDENGEPLSIGRKSRTIPPAIRRALQKRDGGCRFPGCSCRRFVDAHHILHWADGGETAMDNLVLLCRRHHRLVHEGGFGVHRGAGNEIWFSYPMETPCRPLPTGVSAETRGGCCLSEEKGLRITPTLPADCGGESTRLRAGAVGAIRFAMHESCIAPLFRHCRRGVGSAQMGVRQKHSVAAMSHATTR